MVELENSPHDSHHVTHSSQATQLAFSSYANTFGQNFKSNFKKTIFLLCNQQVEGNILSHKLHKVVVNPQISPMFRTENDRIANVVSKNYESWIVQDQTLFIWILFKISEAMLLGVSSWKHAYEV